MAKCLTLKQKRFIDAYLISANATKAAIKAGYSAKTAEVAGSRLLSNAKIQSRLNEKVVKQEQKHEVTREKIVEGFAELAFDKTGAVSDRDKKGALDSLAKIHGMFITQTEDIAEKERVILELSERLNITVDEARTRYEAARARYGKGK